jgi:RNA polymerase sigma-54 factor
MAVTWQVVHTKLQEIIGGEDKAKPFTDQAIVEELAKSGITVARRSVMKHRATMNIPGWRGRRHRSQGA